MIRNTFVRVKTILFCKRKFLLLAIIWFLGLVSGKHYSQQASNTYLLLMRTASDFRLSIVGLAASVFLPFIISALAVYFAKPAVIYVLAYLYALSFSYTGCCLRMLFLNAGWLIQFMLLFSHCISIPFYCWFSMRYINGRKPTFIRDLWIGIAVTSVVGAIDILVISPFLTALI